MLACPMNAASCIPWGWVWPLEKKHKQSIWIMIQGSSLRESAEAWEVSRLQRVEERAERERGEGGEERWRREERKQRAPSHLKENWPENIFYWQLCNRGFLTMIHESCKGHVTSHYVAIYNYRDSQIKYSALNRIVVV